MRSSVVPQTIASETAQKTNWKKKNLAVESSRPRTAGTASPGSPKRAGRSRVLPMSFAAPPNANAKPTAQQTSEAIEKFVRIFATTAPAFLPREKPISRKAKPACMNITSDGGDDHPGGVELVDRLRDGVVEVDRVLRESRRRKQQGCERGEWQGHPQGARSGEHSSHAYSLQCNRRRVFVRLSKMCGAATARLSKRPHGRERIRPAILVRVDSRADRWRSCPPADAAGPFIPNVYRGTTRDPLPGRCVLGMGTSRTLPLRFDPRPAVRPAADIAERAPVRAIARREAVYRYWLAAADVLSAIVAVVVALTVLGDDRVKPVALLAVPLLIVVAKARGLYDRDAQLLKKTTLDEAPDLFAVATLYTLLVSLGDGSVIAGGLGTAQTVGAVVAAVRLLGALPRRRAGAGARADHGRALPGDRLARRRARLAAKFAESPRIKAELVGRVALDEHDEGDDVLGRLADLEWLVVQCRMCSASWSRRTGRTPSACSKRFAPPRGSASRSRCCRGCSR